MANMKFFFLKNIWYFIVADWPTGGEDKIKHNGAHRLTNLQFDFHFICFTKKKEPRQEVRLAWISKNGTQHAADVVVTVEVFSPKIYRGRPGNHR